MAKPELLDILQKGVAAWNDWRRQNRDRPIDLIGANLYEADLRGIDFSYVDLSHADLSESNLTKANLSGSNFRSARLGAANLGGAELIDVNLSNANLISASLAHANLSGCDLGGADLSYASLKGANLGRANFIEATLSYADLSEADLSRAYLYRTDLIAANLRVANLCNANLNYAYLGATDLSGANLNGADFRYARIGWTTFGNAELYTVEGLETVIHDGPSRIGIETLYRHHDRIAGSFLLRAGVSFTFLSSLPTIVESHSPFVRTTCLLAYLHEDYDFAHRLSADLRYAGIGCWLAFNGMIAGDSVDDMGIHSPHVDYCPYDIMLVVTSQNALKKSFLENINRDLQRERKHNSTTPILMSLGLDDTIVHEQKAWAKNPNIQLHIFDFTDWRNKDTYQQALAHLLQKIKQKEDSQTIQGW